MFRSLEFWLALCEHPPCEISYILHILITDLPNLPFRRFTPTVLLNFSQLVFLAFGARLARSPDILMLSDAKCRRE